MLSTHIVFICAVWFWELMTIISLNSSNRLNFVINGISVS